MKLSASRLAQCFVQGDFYAIEANDNHLVFDAKHLVESIPFSVWDGQCHLMRGLMWGTLSITVFSQEKAAMTMSVYGLPWRELKDFAKNLTAQYQTWFSIQKMDFIDIEPKFMALVDEIENREGYLRHADLLFWQKKADAIFEQHHLYLHVLAALNPPWYPLFYRWLKQGEAMRISRNQSWESRELERCSCWFDHIESSPLNLSQRKAVLMDENYNLLLAGAGAGKTSVLMAKVQYLIAKQRVSPEQILVLAFGKKAKEEMSNRLAKANIDNVHVATFHGFASTLIKQATGIAPVLSLLATDKDTKMQWFSQSMTEILMLAGGEKRWLKHLLQWSIPGLHVEKSVLSQINDPRFQRWFWRLLDVIVQQNLSQGALKELTQNKEQEGSEAALIWPLLRRYQKALKAQNTLDFNGLILAATKCLSRKKVPYFSRFDHVLVDEYQDISPARLALLDALLACKRERGASLFAVGDDWQAIYRFSGADVTLTTDFLRRFPSGVMQYLDTTYRFNSKIGDVANRFIQVNPKQLNKPLHSLVMRKNKAVHVIDSMDIEKGLQQLSDKMGENQTRVILIGRNNANKPTTLAKWKKRWPMLSMTYITAHGSKGAEADYTFILDVNDGVFPAKKRTQGLEALLLLADEEIEHAEERRLFYVALTRARHDCWICCDVNKPSPFIIELCEKEYCVDVKINKKFVQAAPS